MVTGMLQMRAQDIHINARVSLCSPPHTHLHTSLISMNSIVNLSPQVKYSCLCICHSHHGNSYDKGITFALMSTSPRLPAYPPDVNELPVCELELTCLCTEGNTMKHSSSAFTKPSIESYLY